jgi:hypothetical protein
MAFVEDLSFVTAATSITATVSRVAVAVGGIIMGMFRVMLLVLLLSGTVHDVVAICGALVLGIGLGAFKMEKARSCVVPPCCKARSDDPTTS